VKTALATGYRHIDTAAAYNNEESVGRAIRESGVPREEIFVTTKVWNSRQGYETTLEAVEDSLEKLGFEYVDLYLIHWAVKGKYKDTWRALEKLYADGRVRSIGVSNFEIHHLEDLLEDAKVVPAVNQVECHPLLTQYELQEYCESKGIRITAWSPLMRGNIDVPLLKELAAKYGKSPAQIILRWDLQRGLITIPKSVTPERIRENADIFDFELSEEDMRAINGLNENRRFGSHPDNPPM
jgi:diketogulonate reductase-like aldo/keto reductase